MAGQGNFSMEDEAVKTLKKRLADLNHLDAYKLENDFYLFQWLKQHNFDVQKAEMSILQSFKWREEMGVCSLSAWTEFPKDVYTRFPIYIDGWTQSGNPVLSSSVGKWDMKSFVQNGQARDIVRYYGLVFALCEDRWIEFNEKVCAAHSEVSHQEIWNKPKSFVCLFNVDQWSIGQMSSKKVVDIYLELSRSLANFPTSLIEKAYYTNTPKMFYTLLKMIKPFVRFPMDVFDHNPTKWKACLDTVFDATTLRKEYGGLR